jgi:hypothetical protein
MEQGFRKRDVGRREPHWREKKTEYSLPLNELTNVIRRRRE